jgi:hypothetical protein
VVTAGPAAGKSAILAYRPAQGAKFPKALASKPKIGGFQISSPIAYQAMPPLNDGTGRSIFKCKQAIWR